MANPASKDAAELFKAQCGKPLKLSILGGQECRLVADDYEGDKVPQDFHAAVAAFIAAPHSVLLAASEAVYAYYRDINSNFEPTDEEYLEIASPDEVWRHVRLGDEASVERRAGGDRAVYISLTCNCDWAPDQGLQIVFHRGERVNKVGPYDSHLSNADAYGNNRLENVVYHAG